MANNQKSPLKGWWAALPLLAKVGIIGGGIAAAHYGSKAIKGARRKDRANRADLAKSTAEFDRRLSEYEEMKFRPIDPDVLDRENVYEELEADMGAVDYAKEQFQQQQANIMQALRGTAGASGIAALAQSLSNQAIEQSRQTQVTIGQQLAENRKLRLQEEATMEQQKRALTVANFEGERAFEIDKMNTLIGVAGQKIAGAQGAIAQRQQMYGQVAGAAGSIAGALIGRI
tara:strand:- start:564 stop:1253 length:690 start_codon:yes stop_codon:yes gene_type:complete